MHSQDYPQDQSCDTPLASFFMHSSSKTPLKSSELEPFSPSHPLFLHTSQQQSACSSKQSPACLQHRQISTQQSSVRSWKGCRPENRATLDGSSDLLARTQGTPEIGPALQAYDGFLRPCNAAAIDTAVPKETAAHVQHSEIWGQCRAENAEAPVQGPFSVIQFPVQPSGMQATRPASTEGKAPHSASGSDSSMQAAHVADAVAGTYCSTAGLGSSATAGCAECSNHASQSSLPMFVSYNRVGASPTGGCQSSAGELSALNSADLAYLGGETSATLSAGFSAPLCGSSSSRASSNASSGQQAASRSPDAWPCVQDSFTLESCGNGHVSSRISSGTARNIRGVHCHGLSGNHVELLHNYGSDDMVLSGSDSELRDQSSKCVPLAACRVSGTSAQTDHCHSIVLAETAETANNGRLQSMGSAVEHGHIELPCSASPAASCDSLYEDDWEA